MAIWGFVKERIQLTAVGLILITCTLNNLSFARDRHPAVTSVKASNVIVNGSTIITKTEFDEVLQRYLGKELYVEDLLDLTNDITQLYVAKGYINSGAILPEQDLASGIIQIDIVEGELSTIEIVESGRISESRIRSLINSEVGHPLNITDLQKAFSKIELEPTIDHIKGQLVPGDQPGESFLKLSVFETDAFNMMLAVNNYAPPSVGDSQVQFRLNHMNLLGFGDDFHIGLNKTEGDESGSIFYRFPVSVLRNSMALYYSTGDTVVVEEPFDEIDIKSETDTTGVRFTTKIKDRIRHVLELSVGLEQKTSTTSLLGVPFDFGQGSVNGESKAAVLELGLQYTYRQAKQAFVAKVLYRRGLDALGATILPTGPDSEFQLYILQFEYVRRLAKKNWLWNTTVYLQSTSDSLQAFERYALGGYDSVRGYRENQVLKDNAYEVRTEVEIPLILSSRINERLSLSIVPFVDVGRGWDAKSRRNENRSQFLSSVGLGLRLAAGGFHLNLDWAVRLSSTKKQGHELQDDGVHLGFSYVF